MNYTNFEETVLLALYQEHVSFGADDVVSFGDLVIKYGLEFKPGWLLEVQKALLSEGLITGPSNSSNDYMAVGKISGRGMRTVEEKFGTLDGVGIVLESIHSEADRSKTPSAEKFDIPASDRVVRLDHNSPRAKEIASKTDELLEGLTRGNDVGDLSADETAAAATEVGQLKLALKAETVRQNTVLSLAKRSLLWIAEKAGEAVIGTVAVALLVAIFAYFGIVVAI